MTADVEMLDVSDLAERLVDWHRRRFPNRRHEQLLLEAIKLGEEAGEVLSAVLAAWTDGDDGRGEIAEECADVLAVLFVIADECGFDLFEAAETKLAELEDRLRQRPASSLSTGREP